MCLAGADFLTVADGVDLLETARNGRFAAGFMPLKMKINPYGKLGLLLR